ncbi:hypothetical protein L1049_017100 [Liquidambar formosana]|uniref:Uncharacterized protein n=1 Tax=Liquidambar formosana TaxID=63359 RepID=A0AAP0X7Z3_LIQFO
MALKLFNPLLFALRRTGEVSFGHLSQSSSRLANSLHPGVLVFMVNPVSSFIDPPT